MKELVELRERLVRRYPAIGLLKVVASDVLGDSYFELPEGQVSLKQYADAIVKLAFSIGKLELLKSEITIGIEDSFDIGIVCALPIELEAILNKIEVVGKQLVSGSYYYIGSLRDENDKKIRIVATCLPGYGNLPAQNFSAKIVEYFKPNILSLVGIAGGIQDDRNSLCLGDLIIPNHVVYYEIGKERKEYKFVDRVYPTSTSAVQRILAIESANDLLPLIKSEITTEPPRKRKINLKRHFSVSIASGEKVVDNVDSRIMKHLKSSTLKIRGVDMESAGVASMLSYFNTPNVNKPELLVIRSICDFADGKKNKIWQKYCSDIAASYLISILKIGMF